MTNNKQQTINSAPVGDWQDVVLAHVGHQSSLCAQRVDLDLVDGRGGEIRLLWPRGERDKKRERERDVLVEM